MPIRHGRMNQLIPLLPPTVIELKPLDGGMDRSIAAWDPDMRAGRVRSPLSENTRILHGVVGKARGFEELGAISAAANKKIMGVSEYEKLDGTKLLMRVLAVEVERYNGTAWFQLTSTHTGSDVILPSLMVANDLFMFANGVDRIQKWDGGDGSAVANLSASAPIARHIGYFLGRIIAADITETSVRDPERMQISDDVDNTDFAAGNSDDLVIAEDSRERPSGIMGLSLLFSRFHVYRKHSIWIAKPTGVATSPLFFQESTAGIGLASSGGIGFFDPIGDIFVGSDLNVYAYSGGQHPFPVGDPIHRDLQESITDPAKIYTKVDTDNGEFWLIAPTFGSTWSDTAWVWDVRTFINEQRIVWRRRTLPVEMISIGEGDVPLPAAVIDDETRLINDINELINDWQRSSTFRAIVFGGTDGYTRFPKDGRLTDENFGSIAAQHVLPQIGSPNQEMWLDTVYVEYRSSTDTVIEVSFSTDGGNTYGNPRNLTLSSTSQGAVAKVFMGLNFDELIPKIRMPNDGSPELLGIRFVVSPRGEVR